MSDIDKIRANARHCLRNANDAPNDEIARNGGKVAYPCRARRKDTIGRLADACVCQTTRRPALVQATNDHRL